MKFCKDCKFAQPYVTKRFSIMGSQVRLDFEFAKCTRPQVMDAPSMSRWASFSDYLVTGKSGALCSIARRDEHACGIGAKYFELKP